KPCDANGNYLLAGSPPAPLSNPDPEDWFPYDDRTHFEAADFLYRRNQMSAEHIDFLAMLWAATLAQHNGTPPFEDHKDLYHTIDSTVLDDVPWKSAKLHYNKPLPEGDIPPWMKSDYDIWFRDPQVVIRNMLANPDFKEEFDYAPHRQYIPRGEDLQRRRKDFMSGDWAWEQADLIAEDEQTHGAMFVPVILGSDKTTVSVATGQNEYYPLYLSIGNVHNNVRRAHRNAVALIGFLSIPKSKSSVLMY
ncbi:hypothetical protein OBBRIDRAFT_743000, partial [Obba rivulosa]